MQLGLTIPLQRYLKLPKPPYGAESDLRFCWDAHAVRLGGVPHLLAVHCSSRYAFVRAGLLPVHAGSLQAMFLEGLGLALEAEGFRPADITRYSILLQPGLALTKTHGRRPVAYLNRAVDDLVALPTGDEALVRQLLNDVPCRAAGHEGVGTARRFFVRDMRAVLEEE